MGRPELPGAGLGGDAGWGSGLDVGWGPPRSRPGPVAPPCPGLPTERCRGLEPMVFQEQLLKRDQWGGDDAQGRGRPVGSAVQRAFLSA